MRKYEPGLLYANLFEMFLNLDDFWKCSSVSRIPRIQLLEALGGRKILFLNHVNKVAMSPVLTSVQWWPWNCISFMLFPSVIEMNNLILKVDSLVLFHYVKLYLVRCLSSISLLFHLWMKMIMLNISIYKFHLHIPFHTPFRVTPIITIVTAQLNLNSSWDRQSNQ